MADSERSWRESSLRWLYLDLNSYFASVEQEVIPGLRNRPVIVVPVMTDSTCAIAASYEAKAFGIRTGTPIREARRRCPDLRVVPARHDLYVDYHHRVLEEIDRHIPVARVESIDEVVCRLMGPERAPAAVVDLAGRIKKGLAGRVGERIRCSIGVAPNRFLAKVASDMEKPDGLTILTAEDLPGRLFALRLRDLPGIGPNMERRLHGAGIFDVATLWHLPPKHARRIWGSVAGEAFWSDLRGIDRPLAPAAVRSSIGHSHVLAPPLRPHHQACLVARRLAAKAASRLRRLDHTAGGLALSARLEDGPRWAADFRLQRTQDTFTILAALDRLWRDFRDRHGTARVKKVGVTLHDLLPRETTTGDLFDAAAGAGDDRRVRLWTMLDGLNRRYGRDTVRLGALPPAASAFTGSKVAFNRIPDPQEFQE